MSNKSIVPDQKVKLRKRKLPSGNIALFLDYVQNDTRMRESLGLTLYPVNNNVKVYQKII